MAFNMTTADGALKEDYLPAVREQLNNTNKLLTQIEKNTEDVEGKYAVLDLHVRRNAGVGARQDGGTLPVAGSQTYVQERVLLKYNYGVIEVTGPTIRATKSDKGSWVRAVDSETKGVTADLKRDYNRQLWGTSDGVIAACAVGGPSTTVNLSATITATQRRQLEVGMFIDIGTVATPTSVASNREILSVSSTTITIAGAAVTTAGTDRIFRTGNGGSGTSQKEVTGMQTIVDSSGTLFNVDPTQQPIWVSTVLSNGGTLRTPSENLFAQAVMDTSIAGGEEPDLFYTSAGVHRAYANNLTMLKRFPNTLDLKGGFKGLAIAAGDDEKALMWERDVPENKAYGVSTKHLFEFQASDWEFMDDDGAVLSRVPGKDAYGATLFKYSELGIDKRNAFVRVDDLLTA